MNCSNFLVPVGISTNVIFMPNCEGAGTALIRASSLVSVVAKRVAALILSSLVLGTCSSNEKSLCLIWPMMSLCLRMSTRRCDKAAIA